MKRARIIIVLMLLFISSSAQVPESFNYQAVVRDASNNPITDQAVSFRISILKGGVSASDEYVKTHSTSTNSLGLVNLAIAEGDVEPGVFSTIDWGADSYFLKVMIDNTGGSSYVEMGTNQLLCVPLEGIIRLENKLIFGHLGNSWSSAAIMERPNRT